MAHIITCAELQRRCHLHRQQLLIIFVLSVILLTVFAGPEPTGLRTAALSSATTAAYHAEFADSLAETSGLVQEASHDGPSAYSSRLRVSKRRGLQKQQSSFSKQSPENVDGTENEIQLPQTHMLVKNGNIVIRAPRTKAAVETLVGTVTATVEKANGYVENLQRSMGRNHYARRFSADAKEVEQTDVEMQREQNGEQLIVSLVVRVPVEKFQELFTACTQLPQASLQDESYKVEDVTAQFVDVAARVASLEATHGQLLQLMNRAEKVQEVLEVQKHLSRVRQELEAKKQQKRWLETSSSLSTLSIRIEESPASFLLDKTSRFAKTVSHALRIWSNLFSLVADGMIYLVVFSPLLGAIVLCRPIVYKLFGDPCFLQSVLGAPIHSAPAAVETTGAATSKGEMPVSQERRHD